LIEPQSHIHRLLLLDLRLKVHHHMLFLGLGRGMRHLRLMMLRHLATHVLAQRVAIIIRKGAAQIHNLFLRRVLEQLRNAVQLRQRV
jgi:hypothetical protein